MQVLMSEPALARVRTRLASAAPGVEILTLDATGALWSNGAPIATASPEAAWLSRDLFRTPLLAAMADYVLKTPSVRWVQTFQAGLDNPMFRQMMATGVRVTKSNAQAPAIAEYVVAHAISLLHPIEEQRRAQEARAWRRVPFREIARAHFLLVGFGSIGQEIAKRLQPFGCQITVVRRTTQARAQTFQAFALADLAQLLPRADVVVLACALNEETRGLAGAAFFAAMKQGSILVNVARGGLVDETALKAGLGRKQPGIAVLDVFQAEPLPPDAWYWDHPQVRLTAHCANDGDAVTSRGDDLFLENLRRYSVGDDLLNEAGIEEVGLLGEKDVTQ